MTPRLDYTQYSTFLECPYLWYEKYVKGMERIYPDYRSNNTRVVGSLVHLGLERFFKTSKLTLEQADADTLNAAPEALYMARSLLEEYIQNYAGEALLQNNIHTEEPLQFTVRNLTRTKEVPCVAKLDSYTEFQETTEVQSLNGSHYCEAGYWIIEHKTKAAELNREKYAQAWVTNVQPDFQIMALQSHLYSQGIQAPVQGVIINVLEKPRNAAPKRKCRQCGNYSEYASWLPTDGKHACPYCGNIQTLTPLGDPASYTGDFYRIIVPRGLRYETLNESIVLVWGQMEELRKQTYFNPTVAVYNFRSCVHPIYGACEFYDAHHHTMDGAIEGPLYRIKEDPLQYIQAE